jgi:uncharacterized membrane protein (UPF0127 family)
MVQASNTTNRQPSLGQMGRLHHPQGRRYASIASPILGLVLSVGAGFCLTLAQGPAQANPKTIPLTLKSFQVQAEVADRPASRAKGLMYRESLPDNQGMLFVFDTPSRQCMWMKNTPLPLSVAFIKADGLIANIAQMQPQTETIHCATEDVLYALEMTQGWFWSRAIKPGDSVLGLPKP